MMGHNRLFACLVCCIALAIAPTATAAVTELASIDSGGLQGDAGSTFSALSADGRIVAFASRASNLVAADTNGADDVFVRDRLTGTTERVSVGPGGAEANGMSVAPAISGDGQVVAFVSSATNLVAGDTNGRLDVFVHDRATGLTSRVSVDTGGLEAASDSLSPSLSFDGSRVVFASSSADLVPFDTNGTFDVFLRDRALGLTTRVSVDSSGLETNGASLAPRISADGLVIAFHSSASNLVGSDVNFATDVFVHDLASGITERASVDSLGVPGNFQSTAASLSSDGRFVAFDSDSTNLVPGDMNFRTDVFVRDRLNGDTQRVSVASDGTEADGQSGFVDPPAISADGRFVAFASGAMNLVPGDGNNFVDIFLHDRATAETTRISVADDGTEGNAPAAHWPSLSADGSVVLFASLATNLVPGDANGFQDVFVRASACGNGVVDSGEACDDGNACTSGDFCSSGVCVSGELDPGDCVDPMRCYKARPADGHPRLKPGKLPMSDYFQDGIANVRGARSVCASVDLDGIDAMPFEGPRLACHRVRSNRGLVTMAGAEITVENQFGVQTLEVYRPQRLCFASGVTAPPTPGERDHYTCYRASGAGDSGSLRIRGMMHNDAYGSFESKIASPVELCVAASVDGSAVAHEQAHLVCYRGRDRRYPSDGDVFEVHQETLHHTKGVQTLDLIKVRRICVPSQILEGGPQPPIG